ncbi:MAG TPA: group II intron reverse transcriptase/maturase [Nakamurella sp.]|nr:group II intron reverse transcriptase/maturase [Nakamurella sp.]
MNPDDHRPERSDGPAPGDTAAHPARLGDLWEQLLSRENLARALRRVERNAGAAGIDGMSTSELRPWLHRHWPEVGSQLDAGTYRPQPVRRVMIPKPGGGQRMLGVPTVLDRLIQQAVLGVLEPVFEPAFSDHSFGFRPGRSAHHAVERARQFIEGDVAWVVDVDLDAFFDRVQHDALMARVARRVPDKQVLKLVRRFLAAGVMADGAFTASDEGTPQGSPLSPLLGNVMLDDLDRELERRGHRFVRYADDVMVYVASERAGQRVMASITEFVEQQLKLRVNREKSRVDRATKRTLLGFGFMVRGGEVKVRVDPKARQRAKDRLRQLTARTWGVPMGRRITAINRFTVGWTAYFALADTPRPFRDLDEWLRRRLRQVRWKEWKVPNARRRNLVALGIPPEQAREWAGSSKGPWRIAGSPPLQRALPNAHWTGLGLHGFSAPYHRFRDAERTAGCGPACPVVWEGPG